MKSKTRIILIALETILYMHTASVKAASYKLDWQTIDGGGGVCAAGKFSLSGTIGQPDTGSRAGGNFLQQGGFWAEAQKSVGPALRIEGSSSNFILSWPETCQGFRLEVTTDLTSGSWTDLGDGTQVGSGRFVSVPSAQGHRYFRLRKDCPQ